MAPYRIAIMNDDMVKFGYDSMQKRTKKDKIYDNTSLKTFKFLTRINSYNFLYFTKTCFVACEVHVYSMM